MLIFKLKDRFVKPMILITLLAGTLLLHAVVAPNEASEVEITPKVHIKGPKGSGGGKPLFRAATGVLGTMPPNKNRRWAVVIGISDYAGTINDIDYADDDALDVLRALMDFYGYRRENILLLISNFEVNNATRKDIIEAIDWLSGKVKEGDEVFFFYSGHGARGKANDGDREAIDEAIVPFECTSESLIWDGELRSMFSKFKTNRIVFVFDSCYSGGMDDLKGDGRIVVMACSETGLSYEGDEWQNGQFTWYFIDMGMIGSNADNYPSDGKVTVEESFDYANANCVHQKPAISDSFANDMLP